MSRKKTDHLFFTITFLRHGVVLVHWWLSWQTIISNMKTHSLSPFKRPFSRWTWVSRYLLKQRMMEVVVTVGAISRAKLQSNHHHQLTNIQCFTGQMPFLSPNQQCQTPKGKIYSMDLLTPSSPGFFQLCPWPLIAPGYLGGGLLWGLLCLASALWWRFHY